MDQINQGDELQKAIDDVTKGAVVDSNSDAAAAIEARIQNEMGVAPTPPMPDMAAPAADLQEMNNDIQAATGESMPPIIGSGGNVQPEPATGDANLEEVKKSMLRDLFPLMDKITMRPEQKYKVYKQMIESTNDKNMIPAAYEAVKGIEDEQQKAEALLFLVDKSEN